ncbi:MAG: phosphotransferase [Acidobacteria bacterium]|nr:phosphotransferase [Acidobacteriota bacterium]
MEEILVGETGSGPFRDYLRRVFREETGAGEETAPVTEIGAGGSPRRFFRVGTYPRSLVGMWSPSPPSGPNGVTENESFLYVAGLFRRIGLPVPAVHRSDPERGWFVLEDAGPTLLHDLLGDTSRQAEAEDGYRRALEFLVILQRGAGDRFEPSKTHNPAYDGAFARRFESGYFEERFLAPWREGRIPGCGAGEGLPGAEGPAEALKADLDALAGDIDRMKTPFTVIHRDYQSTNLTVGPRGVYLLDFQGARLGPPQYDVASLLLDPYADLDPARQDRWMAFYLDAAERANTSFERATFATEFPRVAAHRLLQALGAYGFLALDRGKGRFLAHVPAAVNQLHRLVVKEPCLSRYPVFSALVRGLKRAFPTPAA